MRTYLICAPLSTFETIVALTLTSASPATTFTFLLPIAATSPTAAPLAITAPPRLVATREAWMSAVAPKRAAPVRARCPAAAAANDALRFTRTYVAAPSTAPLARSF